LIDYKNGGISQYDVRAYDLERGRMQTKPVIDPHEPAEKLQGIPLTRVQSPDGRWAYTLYSGQKPFIHALDTEGRTAVCIDVPRISDAELGTTKLRLSGDRLTLEAGGTPRALVDLKSHKVTQPPPAAAAAAATATPRPPAKAAQTAGAGPPWILWTLPLIALGLLVAYARRRGVNLTARER
jgi:MYXO-CTERM domain-containing protein